MRKWVKDHLKPDGTEYDLYRDGLKIYTTIDSKMQQYAEEAVNEHLKNLQKEFFKGKNVANAKSKVPFAVLPNDSFTLKTEGAINVQQSKVAIIPFVKDVLAKKPINIDVTGFIKVKFLGINYTLKFDQESFQYSADLLKDVGLSKPLDKFKQNNPKIAKILGIK